MKSIWCFFCALFAVGCAHVGDTSGVKIQNSVPDDGNRYPSVVSLDHGSEYCSGTLIAPTLYVTAQHCVDTTRQDCGVTIQGVSPDACFSDTSYVRGVYTTENARADTTILVFSRKKKFAIPNTQFGKFGPSANFKKLQNENLTLVGYGATGSFDGQGPIASGHGVGVAGPNGGPKVRRMCQNQISAMEESPTSHAYGLITLSNETSANACLPMPGDSGGPLFRRDPISQRDYIVGIASTVFYPEIGAHRAVYVATYATNVISLLEQAVTWSEQDVNN